MSHLEENENDAANMSRFTIKNEPDKVEQFGVKQEQEQGDLTNVINSRNHVSPAENTILMHKTSIKKEIIVKTENTDDERHEKVVNKHLKASINPTSTAVDLQQSATETIVPMHLIMNNNSRGLGYGKNETKNQIIVDQCVLAPSTTSWDIRDVEGNAKEMWNADDSVKVEEHYLTQETVKLDRGECENNAKGACNITHNEVSMTSSCKGVGFNKTLKEECTQELQRCKKTFECEVCGKSFARKYNFTRHKQIHTGKKPIEFAVCRKSFCRRSNLTDHQRIHTGEKPFKCEVCGKTFVTRSNLKVHQQIHTGEKPFECAVCGKSFTWRSNVKKHQWIHTGEKPFKCEVCGKSFVSRFHLKVHQRLHTGEKPFECAVCGKSFTQRSHLIRHQLMHTREKPFVCAVCAKSFYQRSDLTVHQRIHTTEKPFECAVCRKSFCRRSDLTVHQRIHTGEKPFECAVCRKSFVRRSHLVRHQDTHSQKAL